MQSTGRFWVWFTTVQDTRFFIATMQSSAYWVLLQSSKECLSEVPLAKSPGLLAIIKGYVFTCIICAVICFLATSTIKGYRLEVPLVQSPAPPGIVFNHPRDAFSLHRLLCSHLSSRYGYNYSRYKIVRFRLCSHQPTGIDLQSSKR